jgi:transposase
MTAVAVESTFNWYWLVDGLQDAGYATPLVKTSAVRQYEGLKHSAMTGTMRSGWRT